MGSQGLVSKTDGLNFALPLVVEAKKMMWKELKRRRGLLMTVGQRLFWSLGRSDLGGEGVTLPNISRPLFSSFTAQSIHWFPRLGQGWVEILVKKGTVLLPNISPRTLSDHVSQHCDVIRGQKSDVFTFGISSRTWLRRGGCSLSNSAGFVCLCLLCKRPY